MTEDKKSPEVAEGEESHRKTIKDFHQETAERIVAQSLGRSNSMTEVFKYVYGMSPQLEEEMKARIGSKKNIGVLHDCWRTLNKEAVSQEIKEKSLRRLYSVVPHHPSKDEGDSSDTSGTTSFYSKAQVTLIGLNTIDATLKAAVDSGELSASLGAAISLLFAGQLRVEMAYEFPVAFTLNKKKEKIDG